MRADNEAHQVLHAQVQFRVALKRWWLVDMGKEFELESQSWEYNIHSWFVKCAICDWICEFSCTSYHLH